MSKTPYQYINLVGKNLQNGIDKLNETKGDWINVKEAGAKGDGTTDDTDILQYALDNYKTVYIPSGVFIISKGLKITQNETRITGNWKSSIIRLKSNTTVEYILSTNKTYRWTIENIRIDGNKSNGGVATYGLYHPEYSAESGTSFDNCLITKCIIESVSGIGAYFGWSAGVKATLLEVRYTGGYGIYWGIIDGTIAEVGAWDCKGAALYIKGSNNKITNVKCCYAGTAGDYSTAGIILDSGNNMMSNIECQDNAANGMIITADNGFCNTITNLLMDCNGDKTANPDTGSSGLIVNGHYNQIYGAMLRNTFSGYPGTQHYAISGTGTKNTIYYDTKSASNTDNVEVTLSSFNNKLVGPLTKITELVVSAGNTEKVTINTGYAHINYDSIKVNAKFTTTDNSAWYAYMFKFEDKDGNVLKMNGVNEIYIHNIEGDIYKLRQTDTTQGCFATMEYTLPAGTYYVDTTIKL